MKPHTEILDLAENGAFAVNFSGYVLAAQAVRSLFTFSMAFFFLAAVLAVSLLDARVAGTAGGVSEGLWEIFIICLLPGTIFALAWKRHQKELASFLSELKEISKALGYPLATFAGMQKENLRAQGDAYLYKLAKHFKALEKAYAKDKTLDEFATQAHATHLQLKNMYKLMVKRQIIWPDGLAKYLQRADAELTKTA
jgi:hypothetical protein